MPTHQNRQKLMLAMANELCEVRELLERLAEEFVCDPTIVEIHYAKLQQFDMIAQHIDECGRLIGRMADGMPTHEALETVGLGRMQSRLSAAILEGLMHGHS